MTEAPALELINVTAGYGQFTVLRDVSLRLMQKSVVALLGPNGAGKSTTLRAASGLIAVTSGSVLLHAKDVTKRSTHVRASEGLCMVPEGRGIFPSLTVHENLRLQAVGRQATEHAAERAIDLFPPLRNHLRQTAGTLSGGQQQMVALARTVLSGAQVIMLDEVSMGLSPSMVDQVFGALRRLASQGIALLLVEQYVGRALQMADDVVLMTKGSISLRARASELSEEEVSDHYLGSGGSGPRIVGASVRRDVT